MRFHRDNLNDSDILKIMASQITGNSTVSFTSCSRYNTGPVWGESLGDHWIPIKKDKLYEKGFHVKWRDHETYEI